MDRLLTFEKPHFYFDILSDLTPHLDLWETTYFHGMDGWGDIVEMLRSTGLKPYPDLFQFFVAYKR